MSQNKERIVRYSTEQLVAMRAAGLDRTDWEKARNHPMPDGSDPDDAMEDVDMDWVTTELPLNRSKQQLDADMLDWFKAQGPGYQTKINAVLRSYAEQKSK
ncbi:MAG: hypothetical protein JWN93_1871 [Hyphomicrobiales bacterium]|nr:hypothetical protein [Hyphomicrobiales bacterium]